jgi:hypothetical protein
MEANAPADIGVCQWISLDTLDCLPVSTILMKARRIVEKDRSKPEPVFLAASGI